MTTHPRIFLRRGKEESLLRRHPWIFSGAIGRVECPSDTIAEGEIVDVHTAAGDFIARGHYQIGSIAVRVLTFAQEPIDAAWWRARIRSACEVRRTLGLIGNAATTCYRLVHGEGDSLPGLVIDIYGTTAVVQCHSVGMYRSRMQIAEALREVYGDAVRVVEKPSREELAAADVVLLSTGTIDVESFERPFALPKEEEAFIRTAVESNPNTIVLVNSGSGIRMGGWNDKAAAVIYGWYPGQSGFTALADILSGKLSPSGKLPMTIEKEFNDSPAKGTMPAGAEFYNKAPRAYNERLIQLYDIDYKESVLVGYRWYETKGIAPLYPFGFGLSYTTFELSKPRAPKVFPADKPLKVSVTLTNTGDREGAEVVQLYVTENAPTVLRPKKELKGFRKVTLAPGKSAVVEFELDRQALAFWDTQSRGWKVNPGEYTLSLGTSSADIAATLPVSVK